MEHRRIGKSAVYVSDICMGTMTFGSQTDEAQAHRILDRCLDAGINFFDTADFYSFGASEESLRESITGTFNREELVISSKVGLPMNGSPNARGSSRKHINEAWVRPGGSEVPVSAKRVEGGCYW